MERFMRFVMCSLVLFISIFFFVHASETHAGIVIKKDGVWKGTNDSFVLIKQFPQYYVVSGVDVTAYWTANCVVGKKHTCFVVGQ